MDLILYFSPVLNVTGIFSLLGIFLFKDNTSKTVSMGKVHFGYYYFHHLLTSGWLFKS